jgi:hypothetical protein
LTDIAAWVLNRVVFGVITILTSEVASTDSTLEIA